MFSACGILPVTLPHPWASLARRLILLIIVGTLPLFAVLPIKDKVQALSSNMVFIGAPAGRQASCSLPVTG